MESNRLTIAAARKLLDSGELSARELATDCLKQIKRLNRKLNACLTVCETEALRAADAADTRLKAGERTPLLGIPFLAKDNIMTKGIRTTAASKMLKDYVAPYDATVIERLKTAGAVLLGKTNLDEFAHGSSTEYSAFGPTKNPWDTERVPGGSSGGSAAAVAADMCLFALGTDTGGSVRHPASFCGVVGLKPTYGLASRFGLIAMTSSTDVPGILAKTSEDAALALETIAGADERDATTRTGKPLPYARASERLDWSTLTIGIPQDNLSKTSSAVKKAMNGLIEKIKAAGAQTVPISLPTAAYGIAAYYIITPSEVSANLARFDGIRFGTPARKAKTLAEAYVSAREQGFGGEVKRRIMLGTYALSAGYYDAYYVRAQKVRTKIIAEFETAFEECDLILTPTAPGAAFRFGAKNNKPLDMYLEDMFAVPASLAGLPAISIPAAKKPLPIGAQLIAPAGGEAKLLAAARSAEAFLNLSGLKPEL